MKTLLMRLWRDESGAEIAEWVAVVALVVVIAFGVYTGVLGETLSDIAGGLGVEVAAAH
jgi:Flp pilus assembly pilin Flp